MTLHSDDLRAAFGHALAEADLEATAPTGLGQTAPNVVALEARRSSALPRHRWALVAAAVISVAGLGLAAALATSEQERDFVSTADAPEREALIGPVVAVGLDSPGLVLLDTYAELHPAPEEPSRAIPTAHLRILRSPDGNVVAIADRPADGDGSLDRFPVEVRSQVDGIEVRSIVGPPLPDFASGLDVSAWDIGGRHITLATRGLNENEHDTVLRDLVAASLNGEIRDQVPDGFTLSYAGPDENPFYGQASTSSATYRNKEGNLVAVARYDGTVDAALLARYAWYRTDAAPTSVDGMDALLVEEGQGSSSMYLTTPDGLVVVTGPAHEVVLHARALVPLDATRWAELQASATEPGSIHQTAGTTPPP